MSRQAREISATGFYHIVFRGISRLHLFEEESDFIYFLETLKHLKKEMLFEIHAYCLMSNHVHMLIKERKAGDISLIMKRLLTKYAMYFNRKYDRNGALISSRYKSVPVEVDEYFIPLLCYIHQNPIRAGIVTTLEEYKFSSYREYLHGKGLTDTTFSLELLGRSEWLKLHQIKSNYDFDVTGRKNISEEEIRRRIMGYTSGRQPHEIASWPKAERDFLIHQLKEEGLSIRQIERATGVSRGIVAKI